MTEKMKSQGMEITLGSFAGYQIVHAVRPNGWTFCGRLLLHDSGERGPWDCSLCARLLNTGAPISGRETPIRDHLAPLATGEPHDG